MQPDLNFFFPDDDPRNFALGFPVMPQMIFSEDKGDVLQVRKQDISLGVEPTLEAVEATKAALQWAKMIGACPAEIDQACDLLTNMMVRREK